MSTMHSTKITEGRHIRIDKPGSWKVLKLSNFPLTDPKHGEVRIKIKAIGVNFADVAVRLGIYESAKKLVGWPITPGFDFAGTIEAMGAASEETQTQSTQYDSPKQESPSFKVGDTVFGVSFFGSYSTHITVSTNQIFLLPEGWSFERGAAFPTVHLTAWYALHQLSKASSGQTALIHSAAGGVGLALVQLCRQQGITVIGVVRGSHKVKIVSEVGAYFVIDKNSEPLWKGIDRCSPNGFDLIFDANGYETLKGGYTRLKPEGRLICFGAATMLKRGGGKLPWIRLIWRYLTRPKFDPLSMVSENKSVLGFNLSFLFHRTDLLKVAFTDLLSATPSLIEQPYTTFLLSEVAQAHQHIESGTSIGKLILIPDQ